LKTGILGKKTAKQILILLAATPGFISVQKMLFCFVLKNPSAANKFEREKKGEIRGKIYGRHIPIF
jgi:hypothetical protein